MATALVRNLKINYEVVGNTGPWIALTPGSRRSYHELLDFAKSIASSGYRVLLHDRRNCGSSDVGFDGSASEHEVWVDDLHELAQQLGALPLAVGGSSAGARLAILFAIRHGQSVSSLLLWRVTGGQEAVDHLAQNYYGQFITIAKEGGMKAICESEHFAQCIKDNPSNRDKLLATDVQEFIRVMTVWRERFYESSTLPIVGATEAQLNSISAPTCLIAGNDIIHTPETALKASRLIKNCELHDDVVRKVPPEQLLKEWDRQEWREAEPKMASLFTSFLKSHSIV
jgi:pimeloyl-ACP methyl ester carboxylesterase